ncbi:GntR family transcriptional regulator [Mesorhizobium sp.]|uniref:GntR family transcriptional regulator n=1 Tax=Mesorhizobium sp. TaxID=1871066 RepID=UPI000FE97BB1|nr:GntR family transcriptional regulator [Mesorhizobium sp.]RWB66294.1 MAG: GntR family transcriptional regulator [Mesorhizobium sp.]
MNIVGRSRDGGKIYNALRESILRLDLNPGLVIDETSLCEQFAVSRTPIREAIIQLVSEGLVIRDGRSARVAPVDFSELPKIFDALLVSSRLINRLAAANRTEAHLAEIFFAMQKFETCTAGGDGVLVQDANVAFHLAIAKAAQNHYFTAFYERVLLASSRLALACFSTSDRAASPDPRMREELEGHFDETVRQHTMIYQAIKDKDVEQADTLAAMHQNLYSTRLKTLLFKGMPGLDSVPLV